MLSICNLNLLLEDKAVRSLSAGWLLGPIYKAWKIIFKTYNSQGCRCNMIVLIQKASNNTISNYCTYLNLKQTNIHAFWARLYHTLSLQRRLQIMYFFSRPEQNTFKCFHVRWDYSTIFKCLILWGSIQKF